MAVRKSRLDVGLSPRLPLGRSANLGGGPTGQDRVGGEGVDFVSLEKMGVKFEGEEGSSVV
jgi:hypothetical protein